MTTQTPLDYDQIKADLINFLSTQPEFSGYSFEGSAMNILMDMLAYTTHYMAVHANMAVNEVFLDSAQLRNNVVSKAKELGYIPKQSRGAVAVVNLSVSSSTDVTVPRGTEFSCTVDETVYIFTVLSDTILTSDGSTASGDVTITQGKLKTQTWNIVDPLDVYRLHDSDVDETSLYVVTKPTSSSTTVTVWSQPANLVDVTPTTNAYFIQEGADRKLELYFGDGIVGAKLTPNHVLEVEYLVNNGTKTNGCAVFDLLDDIDGHALSEFTVSTVDSASGGSDAESIESIRVNAPRLYKTQNRAVTKGDCIDIVKAGFTDIQTMNVWGGEDNVPPDYGSVYFCIKPQSSDTLSENSKQFVKNLLDSYKILSIRINIVDPSFTYVNLDVTSYYDSTLTTKSSDSIKTDIINSIASYFSNELDQFDSDFSYSKLLSVIDLSDTSITQSIVSLTISKKYQVSSTSSTTITIEFVTELVPGTISTTVFAGTNTIQDDGAGSLYLYVSGVKDRYLGTVDYTTGELKISDLDGASVGDIVEFTATPKDNVVSTTRNHLIQQGITTITVLDKNA